MQKKIEDLFSKNAQHMRASEIRELLKLLNKPEMISFAGGLPNPDAFPITALRDVVAHVMEAHPREALQYGVTEGHNKLRQAIAQGMADVYGAPQEMSNILITTGSQQALNLIAHFLLDPGDIVLTENPSYLGALMTFRAFQARIETVPMDEQGMVVEQLAEKLRHMRQRNEMPKFIYMIPNFQNPTGATLARDRRRKLYELVAEYDLLLVEDDPYGLLRFEGEPEPLIKSLDTDGHVIYLGSFSKILAPGFRVAWVAGPEEIVNRLTLAKQAQDLCTNTFGQYCVYEAIHHNHLFPHVKEIIQLYQGKRDRMLAAMDKYFSAGVSWTRPQGGMFLWVTLPPAINALTMLQTAIESNVAYVTGAPFFPNGGGQNTLRLNYSYASDDQIEEGIRRLAQVISRQLRDTDGLAYEGMEIF